MAVPYAPTPVTPTDGASLHNGTVQTFVCRHVDPDGDPIQAGEIQLREGGTTTWTTYTATLLDLGNQRATFDIPSGTMVPAGQWETRFRTSDGAYGPWSAIVFFSAFAQPSTPVITSGSAVSSNPSIITWTAADQEAYQVRRKADDAGALGTTLWTGPEVTSTARQASVAFPTSPQTEHVQVRIRHQGVWSAWAPQQVTVNYTYPDAPIVGTVAVTPPAISVTVDNPATGATVTANNIQRQQSIDQIVWTDRYGNPELFDVVATIGPDGTHNDTRIAHLTHYRYRAEAVTATSQGRLTGQLSYQELEVLYPTYRELEAAFPTYWEMQGSWTE